MSQEKAVLMRCSKCKRHAFWKFADGSISEQFYTTVKGGLLFLEGVASGKASFDESSSAIDCLSNSGLPATADATTIITGAFEAVFGDNTETEKASICK